MTAGSIFSQRSIRGNRLYHHARRSDGIRIDIIDKDIKITTIQPGIVQTDFSEVRFHGDSERAEGVYKGIEALQPEDIADVVLYVANQPKRVQITDVTIMANQQGTGFNIYRK